MSYLGWTHVSTDADTRASALRQSSAAHVAFGETGMGSVTTYAEHLSSA